MNVGVEVFSDALHAEGVRWVHVDWRLPAGRDLRLAAMLAALDDEPEPPAPETAPA